MRRRPDWAARFARRGGLLAPLEKEVAAFAGAGVEKEQMGRGENESRARGKEPLDADTVRSYRECMEKVALKRPLETEGIPPLIDDPQEALAVFEELLKRGASFYPEPDEASQGPRVHRIVSLAES
jgi:hypothetical protein